MHKILLDGLQFEAPLDWTFYSMGPLILGRSGSKVGSLQISQAFRHDLPGTASKIACFDLAVRFVARDGMDAPRERVEFSDRPSLFGRFDYTVGKEVGRVWYRLADGNFVIGAYVCKIEILQQRFFEEAEEIMKSVRFQSSNDKTT